MVRKIVLRGKGRARGRAHGEELRDLVLEQQERWTQALQDDIGLSPEPYLDRLFAETNFMPAIERWTPDLLEEVRGIAEGAGTDFRLTLARQLSDEEPWFRREIWLQSRIAKGCSSLGVDAAPDRPALIAQNMDMPLWHDGHQVLLHSIDPDSPVEVLSYTVAGKISLAGLNSAGVGICCNSMNQLDHDVNGLPEDFVVRGFLSQPTLAAGLDFMHRVPHASPQNYVVGGPGQPVVDLEVSASSIHRYRTPGTTDRVLHTNHPLVNPDDGPWRRLRELLPPDLFATRFRSTSQARLAALHRLLGRPDQPVTPDTIRAAFSQHDGPVCRHGEVEGRRDAFTLGCLIMELSDRPSLHVAAGPPCSTPFQIFGFGA